MKIIFKKLLMVSVILVLTMSQFSAFAQKVKTLELRYTYYAPLTVSPEQAKRTALEQAKLQVIADEFGTLISQYGKTVMSNNGDVSKVQSHIYSGSEVRGEWIETLGEPDFKMCMEGDMLVVTVRGKGRAREILSAPIDVVAKVLRNGTDDKFEDDNFNEGDDVYISFKSPVDGYLAIYLVDDDEQAWCLLPYHNQQLASYPIERGKRYVFGSKEFVSVQEKQFVDEYRMTCSRQQESNTIYIIFSPNEFTRAVDIMGLDGKLPRHLSFSDFDKWLVKNRKHDVKMTLSFFPITIFKNK